MPLLSPAGANAALGGLAAVAGFTSQHTATPGTTGASEYAGTTRVATVWNTPSGGTMTNSGGLSLANSGTTPVTHLGQFSAASAGTYEVGEALGSSVQAASISVAAGAISLTGS